VERIACTVRQEVLLSRGMYGKARVGGAQKGRKGQTFPMITTMWRGNGAACSFHCDFIPKGSYARSTPGRRNHASSWPTTVYRAMRWLVGYLAAGTVRSSGTLVKVVRSRNFLPWERETTGTFWLVPCGSFSARVLRVRVLGRRVRSWCCFCGRGLYFRGFYLFRPMRLHCISNKTIRS
jgi:hypothetical protein